MCFVEFLVFHFSISDFSTYSFSAFFLLVRLLMNLENSACSVVMKVIINRLYMALLGIRL